MAYYQELLPKYTEDARNKKTKGKDEDKKEQS